VIISETRLKEIIFEEIELHLLREELESLNEILLNEGIVSYLNDLFSGDEKRWKEIVDGAAEGKPPEEVLPDKQTFLSMPTKQRIATLALIATVFAGGLDFATKYYDVKAQAAQSAQMINDTMEDAKDRARTISNFRQMAAAEAEHGGANTPEEVQQALDDIRNEYQLKKSPLGHTGLMAKGKLATGFAYAPADQIDDSAVLPMTGMTKEDFETLLRLQWLSADAEGDRRLRGYVTGDWDKGSSAFWAYQDSLYAPVADAGDDETKELMTNMYNKAFDPETTLMLPLEWSVAYDLLQQRHDAGRI
tara:strand:+ start:806 stop:1720 length:915 start_codon:yes stop_codon:yes gene_type:complete